MLNRRTALSLFGAATAVTLLASLSACAGTSRHAGLAAAAAGAPCAAPAGRPWCDTALGPDRRAALLIARLTGDEKLGLMAGDDMVGPLKAEGDARFRAGTVHGVARLGVPDLYLVDAGSMGVKQGPNTALASGLSLAATFDTAAAGRAAGVVADEAARHGNDVVLGPAVDIMRTPRSGRAFEAYGEDPLLSSRLGTAWIRAVQKGGLMAEVKHFPANNQEDHRYTVNASIGQRALREVYLAPFEAAVKQGGAATVMCGYNRVNGSPSCSSSALLDGVLRREWGFKGAVVSDWMMGVKETSGSVKAGLGLEMPLGVFYTPPVLREQLRNGEITWADVDARLAERLRTMFAFGAFDRARRGGAAAIDRAAHARTARELSEQGVTLLKNSGGTLPLKPGGTVAIIGRAADTFRSGVGSAHVAPVAPVTARQGLTARAGAGRATYTPGTDLAAAAKAARAADVAVVFAADRRAEDADVACLTLACGGADLGDQDELITTVAAANPRTVVVLQTGGPVLTPWAAKVKGIVEAWYPGERGGDAIARVLYGDVDPGGRLPVSFPAREADAPASGGDALYPGVKGTVTYAEGVNVGYRGYDSRGVAPAFPFGYGLSYTTFKLSGLKATRTAVTATVTNTGKRTGYAVPQLYLGLPSAPGAPQPARQLKGFTKIALAPGRSAKVTFPLDARSFAYWDEARASWRTAPGCTSVLVGTSARATPLAARLC
ncbi:beta-glucosidase [Actinomadura parmotrematis]|uniref:Glycoside hydrolase family 3 C-terminal domain-containing protein n=1 Tax=Actinomadura parmotrematis TaxID=2864039 RepID=A0ABS7FPT9_9ACTN|nr:glycoside hydrolase family 3 C-terminal domain-containing protein [Actinomadura parmotrematis]MBW8482245.1 glycoside hydrolase family 3 C-terminal domain-containing protein [Actinomadura parmotrematis]